MKFRPNRTIAICAIYLILHFVLHLAAGLFEGSSGLSIWYPPNGLALALLILLGPRYAPWVLFTHLLVAYGTHTHGTWWVPLVYPVLITANATVTAVIARHFSGPVLLPTNPRQAGVFSLVVAASPLCLALAGTGIQTLISPSTPAAFFYSVYQWWVGDVSGLIAVLPVVMVFASPALLGKRALPIARVKVSWGQTAIQGLTLFACLGAVFALEPIRQHHAYYLCFIPLSWVALSHGLPGASLATLITATAGLIGMHFMGSPDDQILNFLLFEIAAAAVGLGLGAATSLRIQSEKELAESKERFERVITGAQLGLWDWDINREHVSYNARCAEMLGIPFKQLDPNYKYWASSTHPADKDRVDRALRAHLQGSTPIYEVEYRIRHAGQSWRWLLTRGSVVAKDSEGNPTLMSGTHLDVTDRKHAEGEMHRLLQINEVTTDFIVTTDISGGITYANAALLELQKSSGAPSPLGRSLFDLMPAWAGENLRGQCISAALSAGTWTGELALRLAENSEMCVSVVALSHRDLENDNLSLSFIMRDITPQKLAEEERIQRERNLLQLQKLESLGTLAGGMAHDFNNLLTIMLGNASLARFELPPGAPVQAPLGQIESAAMTAAELCQQMLAYAGRSPLAFQSIDLRALLEECLPLLRVSVSKHHALEVQSPPDLPLIHADPTQIRQICMNLAINASEAIGEQEGEITLRVSVCMLNEEVLRTGYREHRLVPGRYVMLEVQDSGPGMMPETFSRIFEPFYSTKQVGHGLGLAAVLGIMRSHGGGVSASTEIGTGTCVRLIFPALDASAPATRIRQTAEPGWKGSGTILVADDDAITRRAASRCLESLGFKALLAKDGVEALDLFRQNQEEIRLILLDITMPRLDGEELFSRLQDLAPRVPIVLMSSFAEKWLLDHFVTSRPAAFIAKPFDRRALETCLQQLLA